MKRLATLIVGAIIGIAATLIAAAPASAAYGSACGSTHICIWTSVLPNNGQLPLYYWTAPTSNQCIPFGSAINDKTRTIRQTGGFSATLYTNAGCSGSIITTAANGLNEEIKACGHSGPPYGPWANSPCYVGTPTASSIWYVA